MGDFTFSSDFWSWWVIVLTVGNILGCWWLIVWTMKKRAGEAASGDVTHHTWDETLQEYNNPLPRWWLWLFYITLVFAVIYLVLYPGLGKFRGVLGWTGEVRYEKEMAQAEAKYGPIFANYAEQEIPALAADEEAVRTGRRLFLNYCATCHGSDARGFPGFPNLTDDAWLFGGDPASIKTSILNGRGGQGLMMAWEGQLGEQGVDEVTEYVLQINGREVNTELARKGQQHYQQMCVSCHGIEGKGNQALGAPDLTDAAWLYGGSPGTIRESIAKGRNGRMPAHKDFLGEDKVHLLAAYVYSLSN
ncbi:Cbb3-type cytochrome c oxidase subunit [Thiohalobacter sp. COW1]|uniref:Cbb3-type cytochrome c oxidase subunit n=1 Tax=Thiohalobacter thiocyanaticus TaxID=585455 RepID=A0A1Z4VNI5_9GAMM|nr:MULTISPECIES: cytochrome-c oxidase, cbb3-type subunit III [Thiohalobacter]BAZ92794.1 cytochrome c oxidase, cbb3-type subunit III [Thiohalobacter thiocyanaticus]BCO32247.1 Cbb3-type cytochrome c oxidase subunit [Thiohalobacter sp. COW1]